MKIMDNTIIEKAKEMLVQTKSSGTKAWYLSKTLWVDGLFIAAYLVQSYYGFIISPEEQIAIIAVANLILRAVTGKELTK